MFQRLFDRRSKRRSILAETPLNATVNSEGMKQILPFLVAGVAGSAFFLSSARATTLTATIENFSSQSVSFGRQAVHAVDGSGLDASNPPSHSTNASHMWMTTGDGAFGAGPADPDLPAQLGHITFKFHQPYLVGSFRVWNYNELSGAFDGSIRGIKDFTISTSLDGTN
jgi:hypothetical protein